MDLLQRDFRVTVVDALAHLLGVSSVRTMKNILAHIQDTVLGYPDYSVSVGFKDNNPEREINLIRVDYTGPHPLGEDNIPMTKTSFTVTSYGDKLHVDYAVNTYQGANDQRDFPVNKWRETFSLQEAKDWFDHFCNFTWDANKVSTPARQRRNFAPSPAERMPA